VIIVSRRLGHVQSIITIDAFGHLILTKQKEVAFLRDELLTPTIEKLQIKLRLVALRLQQKLNLAF
jgi:hypothetical protein